jgi:hypothetical protein
LFLNIDDIKINPKPLITPAPKKCGPNPTNLNFIFSKNSASYGELLTVTENSKSLSVGNIYNIIPDKLNKKMTKIIRFIKSNELYLNLKYNM